MHFNRRGEIPYLPAPALLAGLKDFNGSVNLILDTKAQAGGLLMSSGSVDQKNTYVFEVMPHGVVEGAAKELCYWSTGNGDDTMVTLWNPADEPQDLSFTLFYTGGQYVYPIYLGPRETRTMNVSDIVHTSIPDAAGNVIPAGLTEGSAEIAGSLGEQQQILLSLDVATYNVRKATCGVVCWECDGIVYAAIDLSPFAVAVGGTTGETFYETSNTGNQYGASASWRSSSTSIATVNTTGVVAGVSTGSLTLYGNDLYAETDGVGWYCTDIYFFCPTSYFNASTVGSSASPPSVSFSNINYVVVGQTATITAAVTPSNNSIPISLSISSAATIVTPTGTFKSTTPVVVKGLTVGNAILTATISNADGSKKTVGSTSFLVAPSISLNPSLWFFGTGVPTPPNFNLGATSATLTANGTGSSGTYQWTVTSGTSEVAFSNGGQSINITNSNTVVIYATSFSTGLNDVSAQVVFTPAGGTASPPGTLSLTIDSPYQLVLQQVFPSVGVSACAPNYPTGNAGWYEFVPYLLKSRFGVTMGNTPVNESFGQRMDSYSHNSWPTPTPGPWTTGSLGTYSDNLCVLGSGTPTPLPPQSPLSNVLVFQLEQTWSAGTLSV